MEYECAAFHFQNLETKLGMQRQHSTVARGVGDSSAGSADYLPTSVLGQNREAGDLFHKGTVNNEMPLLRHYRWHQT